MNAATIIVAAVVITLVCLALRSMIKGRQSGGCGTCGGCGCSDCHENARCGMKKENDPSILNRESQS